MASAGPNFPSAAVAVDRGGRATWNNPTFCFADDANNAACPEGATGSDYLVTSGYGFSIPSGATINGVTVRIGAGESGSGSSNYVVQLQSDTTPTLIGSSKASGTVSGTTIVEQTFGSISDTWSASLSSTVVNASGFGVSLWTDDTNNTLLIDYISIEITYTVSGGGLFTAGGYYKVP